MAKIGIIGGTGLDNAQIMKGAKDLEVVTPFGRPSSPLRVGVIDGVEVVLLSRHGRRHTIPPSQVNNRANIAALKEHGCTHILATTACGSLREEIKRGDFVVPDQFIDFTRHRKITFFEDFQPGIENAKHTPMADPFSEVLRQKLVESARELGLPVHDRGTVITIEGNRFSTRAESKMFRMWGADVINMSTAPEVTLANEAGIPYGLIAISTDYDCWKTDEKPVDVAEIISVFHKNIEYVKAVLLKTIAKVGAL